MHSLGQGWWLDSSAVQPSVNRRRGNKRKQQANTWTTAQQHTPKARPGVARHTDKHNVIALPWLPLNIIIYCTHMTSLLSSNDTIQCVCIHVTRILLIYTHTHNETLSSLSGIQCTRSTHTHTHTHYTCTYSHTLMYAHKHCHTYIVSWCQLTEVEIHFRFPWAAQKLC